MAKLTVLEMTQDILSDMGSDEVNSISDTVESLQVAQILKSTYFEIINDRLWPTHDVLGQLEGLADTNKPTHMKMPDDLTCIDESTVRYDVRELLADPKSYKKITYKYPQEFLDIVNSRDSTSSTVQSVTDFGGAEILVNNDRAPLYWTSFDDVYVVFDSFNSDLEATLSASKTQVVYNKEPSFTISDSFTPDLPAKAFSYYLAEAKSVCFNHIAQEANAKEEQKSRRQRTWLAREKRKQNGQTRNLNDYGRK